MAVSARPRSLVRRVFTAHVALGIALCVTLSAVGAFLTTSGAASQTQELSMSAPAAPPSTITPSIAPKPVATAAAPKPTAKVAPRVIVRTAAPAPRPMAPPAAHVAPVAGGSQMKTALIVGVAHPVGAQELQGALADANNTRAALIKYGFPAQNIQMLIDGQATRANIIAGLHSLANRTSRSGLAVFAVSTHSSTTSFRTYEGNRIQRGEVASLLAKVPGRLWSMFAVCYADSYNIPGVTGPNRIATFSSAGSEETWESPAGSDFVRAMVKEAMLDGKAPDSIEGSFGYANAEMLHNQSGHPSINDQIPGHTRLG